MLELPAPLEREWLWSALESVLSRRGEAAFIEAPLVLPSDRFFPDRFTPDERGVAVLAGRLLGYAGLDHLEVSVELYEEDVHVQELGLDGRAAKWSHDGAAAWFAGIQRGTCLFGARRDGLGDPLGLVASMAHEVAHAFRRSHRLEHENRDHEEKLTDVTTVYLGFGVLTTATTARYETHVHGNTGSAYSHKRQGYLAPGAMSFLLATQLVMRGYDARTIRWYAKHLPANQRALVLAAAKEIDRARVADVLGYDSVPPPQPSPLPPATWWQRLLGI